MKLAALVTMHMTHIHRTAPGPPRQIAPAAPELLPVPTRAAAEIENAWNALRDLARVPRPPRVLSRCALSTMERIIRGIIRICTPLVRHVKYSESRTTTGTPGNIHSHPSKGARNSLS